MSNYNLSLLLYQLSSPNKCKFNIDNSKFTFTWRTQVIQKLPQIRTLDEHTVCIKSYLLNAPGISVYSLIVLSCGSRVRMDLSSKEDFHP